jgi:hypothetical protein
MRSRNARSRTSRSGAARCIRRGALNRSRKMSAAQFAAKEANFGRRLDLNQNP